MDPMLVVEFLGLFAFARQKGAEDGPVRVIAVEDPKSPHFARLVVKREDIVGFRDFEDPEHKIEKLKVEYVAGEDDGTYVVIPLDTLNVAFQDQPEPDQARVHWNYDDKGKDNKQPGFEWFGIAHPWHNAFYMADTTKIEKIDKPPARVDQGVVGLNEHASVNARFTIVAGEVEAKEPRLAAAKNGCVVVKEPEKPSEAAHWQGLTRAWTDRLFARIAFTEDVKEPVIVLRPDTELRLVKGAHVRVINWPRPPLGKYKEDLNIKITHFHAFGHILDEHHKTMPSVYFSPGCQPLQPPVEPQGPSTANVSLDVEPIFCPPLLVWSDEPISVPQPQPARAR